MVDPEYYQIVDGFVPEQEEEIHTPWYKKTTFLSFFLYTIVTILTGYIIYLFYTFIRS